MKYFFTSDTHFNHANIIKYCNRPFVSVNEMNEQLINNWNSVVGNDDVVYHLGDIGFFNSNTPEQYTLKSIIQKLNGRIYLIMGNHDDWNLINKNAKLFAGITNAGHVYINNIKVYLNHFPYLCFDGSNRGAIQMFGHVHSGPGQEGGFDIERLQYLYKNNQYDVGVDNNNYKPVEFNEILQKLGRGK